MMPKIFLPMATAMAALMIQTGGALAADDDGIDAANEIAATVAPAGGRPTAHVNPLPAPSTAGIRAESRDPEVAPGAIGVDPNQIGSQAFGSFGIPYTTSRVQLGNGDGVSTGGGRLGSTYPYRAIGRLDFTTASGASSFCSASLIGRSVIVTAAHCIQNFGAGATRFTNWRFTPAFYAPGVTAAEKRPYGQLTWARVVWPGSWQNGTDIGSGAARDNDLAVMIVNKTASGQFIGDIVGRFAYGWNNYSFVSSSKTGNLATAAISTLGYPGLMDNGGVMQRTDGPTYTTTVGGAGQLWQGSNFTGGSSGGPWLVNFAGRLPTLSGGAAQGTASVMAVVGVTSWGASDPNSPKDNYSSQFRQNSRYPNASYGIYGAGNIGSLMNTLCSAVKPGGNQTWQQLGYCF